MTESPAVGRPHPGHDPRATDHTASHLRDENTGTDRRIAADGTLSGIPPLAVLGLAGGAFVHTADGPRPLETLAAGDRVMTRDSGLQTVRWIGSVHVSPALLHQAPHLRPVRIAAGALGSNAAMLVAPGQRMMLGGWRAEVLFGEAEVLATALSLTNGRTISVAHDIAQIEYYHILLDTHEIVAVDDAWSESLYPPLAKTAAPADTRLARPQVGASSAPLMLA